MNIANIARTQRIRAYDYSLEKALDAIYTSHTLELLQIENGELYVQSPAYVYEMLLKELRLYPVFEGNADKTVADDTAPMQ